MVDSHMKFGDPYINILVHMHVCVIVALSPRESKTQWQKQDEIFLMYMEIFTLHSILPFVLLWHF